MVDEEINPVLHKLQFAIVRETREVHSEECYVFVNLGEDELVKACIAHKLTYAQSCVWRGMGGGGLTLGVGTETWT